MHEFKGLGELQMFESGWVHLDRATEFLGMDDDQDVRWKKELLRYIRTVLGVGWEPCAHNNHAWEEKAERFFRCSVCGVAGYRRYNSMMGTAGEEVFEFLCPGCKGPTTGQGDRCPRCGGVRKRRGKDAVAMKSWDALRPSEQRAILFLAGKASPTTISMAEGGGMVRVLSQRGIIQSAGERNGQNLWELTNAAYKKYREHFPVGTEGGLGGKKEQEG